MEKANGLPGRNIAQRKQKSKRGATEYQRQSNGDKI
jgi:hypothetical protein